MPAATAVVTVSAPAEVTVRLLDHDDGRRAATVAPDEHPASGRPLHHDHLLRRLRLHDDHLRRRRRGTEVDARANLHLRDGERRTRDDRGERGGGEK